MCPKSVTYSHLEGLYPCLLSARTKFGPMAIDILVTTFRAGICSSKGDVLGLPYFPECIHELLTKLGKSFSGDMIQLIIALQRGRVLFHIHLAPVDCVLQKVLQDGHGEAIVVEVDLGELRAMCEGR